MTQTSGTPQPPRKISEVMLDFASILTEPMGPDLNSEQLEGALQVAFTVWNAIVLDAVAGNQEFVTALRQLAQSDPTTESMVEALIQRKQTDFRDDLRLIGDYKLTQTQGQWNLRAEARDPRRSS